MEKVEINKAARLSEHFKLGEMCKTSAKTADGNIPSHVHIENLKRLCGWLEKLRERYNRYYVLDQSIPCVRDQTCSCAYDQTTPDPSYSGGETSGGILPLSRGSQRGSEEPIIGKSITEEPIIINSGYRSEAVNKAVGGAKGSNHLTGCAADIRVAGIEQLVRYATILLDISDESKEDFDELLLERSPRGSYWLHFAVRPSGNRRKVRLIQT